MGERSPIYLLDGATGEPCDAELCDEIGPPQLADWHVRWRPVLLERLRELHKRGVPSSSWPQGWHWDWEAKMARVEGLLAYRGFSVVAGGITQGLAQLDLTRLAREPSQKGKPLVYVNHLETAPWNRRDLGFAPRYRGVGSALLAAAVALSEAEEFKGTVGLHSLPQSDEFYARMGMANLGTDAAVEGLTYFEFTAEQARALLAQE